MKVFKTIGLMSGTSLDAVDMAFVEFFKKNEKWHFKLGVSESVSYSFEWKNRLLNLTKASALDYVKTHTDFGHYLGKLLAEFIHENELKVDFIASHGHTVFHQPEGRFTSQIGDGSSIVSETGVSVVCDFRSLDMAKGGQGAPLVPIGDALLFGDYQTRINLGGFSNISIGSVEDLRAFDICPVNIVLNKLANKLGQDFDRNGELARGGQLIPELLEKLNQRVFYQQTGPKSLGVEWVEREVLPLLDSSQQVEDQLRTFVEHSAIQISNTLNEVCSNNDKVLFSGGGVYNSFLMERIQDLGKVSIEIPSSAIIEMKEAIVFAFLGLLRFLGEENILKSYTGAKSNSVSGAIYFA